MENKELDRLLQIQSEIDDFEQWLIDKGDWEAYEKLASASVRLAEILNETFHRLLPTTPPDLSSGKFLDEFRAELQAQGLSLPGELMQVGLMADLVWEPPCGGIFDFRHFSKVDPAFVIEGYSRLVAFWRVEDQIRYYAARLEPGKEWYWSGEDPERTAAVDAESEYYEIAILASVKDAVRLMTEYLSGKSLVDIEIRRTKP